MALVISCGKDHERKKLLEGNWQRTGEARVNDYNMPHTSVVFNPVSGCYVHDVFSYSSNGKYKVENTEPGCLPFSQTYDYKFDADEMTMTLYTSNGNPFIREVVVLTNTELILKAKLISGTTTGGDFSRFVRR